MEWGEAIRLVGVLALDPSSELAAQLNDWQGRRSPEWLILADLYDAFGAANFKHPKAYPRPFLAPGARRMGRTRLSRDQVIAVLNRHGHQLGQEDDAHG